MSDIESAWAAGLFEGEGCITGDDRVTIKLRSTDEDVVRRFHDVVGGLGQVRVEDYFARNHGYKRQWEWYTNKKRSVYDVLRQLRPWLGSRRGERADAALAVIEAKGFGGRWD